MTTSHKETVLLVGGPYDGDEQEVTVGWNMLTLSETYYRHDDGNYYWGRTPMAIGETARALKGDPQ